MVETATEEHETPSQLVGSPQSMAKFTGRPASEFEDEAPDAATRVEETIEEPEDK